ncbi:MAG: hypothetical protein ABSG91_19965 [Syntrophobacteraceae bacterium]
MRLRTRGEVLKVLLFAAGVIMLAGCGMQWPHAPEFGFNWVSREGKSQEQLYEDQTSCRRYVRMLQGPDFSGPGGSGWGMSEMKAFDDCLRSKGWEKK